MIGDGGDVFVALLTELTGCPCGRGFEGRNEENAVGIIGFTKFARNLLIHCPSKYADYSTFTFEQEIEYFSFHL